jgi:hypothetical protein
MTTPIEHWFITVWKADGKEKMGSYTASICGLHQLKSKQQNKILPVETREDNADYRRSNNRAKSQVVETT